MEYPRITKEDCLGCGVCEDMCPAKAITMDDHIAHIKVEQCRNCQACVQMCPVQAISV